MQINIFNIFTSTFSERISPPREVLAPVLTVTTSPPNHFLPFSSSFSRNIFVKDKNRVPSAIARVFQSRIFPLRLRTFLLLSFPLNRPLLSALSVLPSDTLHPPSIRYLISPFQAQRSCPACLVLLFLPGSVCPFHGLAVEFPFTSSSVGRKFAEFLISPPFFFFPRFHFAVILAIKRSLA